ncbi:hypothetical protein AMAG_19299 [Allomyces macrogynus ATCC 38327]|uniref:Uncharacterized protein n=1 Tax=Allomyces macrogynus (strain ATCC 38327) TaxID=578462 RepID=A0A0L0STW8_ALLM3|nr:hypothetical protein AMAG_19299 [Allomyces macrogynus ATCC 38327]|eukprot:KNE65941.1 hypothetical protein AMAG_19299 [Allomyces macrogynus ATCC 38327]
MADALSNVSTTPSTVSALDQTTAALVVAASVNASAAAMFPFMPAANGAPTVDVDPVLLHATVTAVMVAAAALNGGDPASTLSSPAITGSLNASPDASSIYDAGYSSTGFHPTAAAVASPFPLATLGPADVEVATVAAMAAAMLSASGVLPLESPSDVAEPVPLDMVQPAPLPMGTPSTLWPSASPAAETVPLTSATWDTPTTSGGFRDSGMIPSLWHIPGSDATVAPAPAFTTFTSPGTPLALGPLDANASCFSGAPTRSSLGSTTSHGAAMPRPTTFGPGSAFSTAAASRSTTSLFPPMTAAPAVPSAWAPPRTEFGLPAAQFDPGEATFSTAASTATLHPATAMGVLSCAPQPPAVSPAMPCAFAAAGPVAFGAPDVAATSIFMPPPPPPPPLVVAASAAGSRESSGPMGSGSAEMPTTPVPRLFPPHADDAHVSAAPLPPAMKPATRGRGKGRARARGRGGVRSTPATRRKARRDASSSSEGAGDASPSSRPRMTGERISNGGVLL